MIVPSDRRERLCAFVPTAPYWRDLAAQADPSTFPTKAGPHYDLDGNPHPPIGTLGEQLQRAQWGDPPPPWTANEQERFLATLDADEAFRDAVAVTLQPALHAIVRRVLDTVLGEAAA